ncbi:MAG: TetR/AcrR family transcriptional regulator [Sciscionella sp.]
MPESAKPAAGRADRILDAAGAMLLRLGYRKVTVDDIAKRADIGKGTVYLHWRTKEQLFEALLRRESIELVQEILDRLREDPAEAAPHRFARTSYLATCRNPLMAALACRDTELLGRLSDTSVRGKEILASEEFFDLMVRHGLLRDDVPHLAYSLQATSVGFWLIDSMDPVNANLDQHAKADALAYTIRHAFEPAGEPDPAALVAAAARMCAVFEDLISTYDKWIYSPESG